MSCSRKHLPRHLYHTSFLALFLSHDCSCSCSNRNLELAGSYARIFHSFLLRRRRPFHVYGMEVDVLIHTSFRTNSRSDFCIPISCRQTPHARCVVGKVYSMVTHIHVTHRRDHCSRNQKYLTNHADYGKDTLVQGPYYSLLQGNYMLS